MSRFFIVQGSESGHCCFQFSVADKAKPISYHGVPFLVDGLQQYETVCECFFKEHAELICDALNAKYPIAP